MKSISYTLRFWFKNARPQSLPQSVMPAILALFLAYSNDGFSFPLAIFALFGVILGHLGLNLFDDYFDYKKKKSDYRDHLVHKGFRARIGKCVYLTDGSANVKDLLLACCVICGIALCIGGILLYYRGVGILYFMILTAILGISYSGSPFRFSYRGLGELLIGVMFGPMTMLGTFYAACGIINMMIVLISIPVGLLVANIVYVHSILDFEPDKEIGKHTLAVLLNNKKWMLVALFLILFTPYVIISLGVILGYIPLLYLLLFITFPLAAYLFYMMVEFVKNPDHKFEPQKWMGPMANWERLQAIGIDWFMIRWYLARNLLSSFCFIIIILCIIL
ncbi:MAG: prenyltransferase [Prevotella sp.]|jgi:1,4-dihydroxy-2-naphthoate octaprenyltransferase|nr:prenyltransferase [Prevotella sp.]